MFKAHLHKYIKYQNKCFMINILIYGLICKTLTLGTYVTFSIIILYFCFKTIKSSQQYILVKPAFHTNNGGEQKLYLSFANRSLASSMRDMFILDNLNEDFYSSSVLVVFVNKTNICSYSFKMYC